MKTLLSAAGAGAALFLAMPAAAQDETEEDPFGDSVYAGDYLSIGAGVAVSSSYTGSDDYVFSPLPVVQGRVAGIEIDPRAAGVGLDFVPNPEEGIGFNAGIAARLRSDRASQIEDEVVKSLGELDRAIEVGPTVGITIPEVLSPFGSLTLTTDVMWDINGAHEGMVVAPSIAYFTPLSRSMAASLTLSAEWADDDFHEYYFSVSPEAAASTGLPEFEADSGITSLGGTLLLAYDLDGDLANGGWGVIGIAGYSRVVGDAADTPFTSIRGSKDQFLGAIGVGYTF